MAAHIGGRAPIDHTDINAVKGDLRALQGDIYKLNTDREKITQKTLDHLTTLLKKLNLVTEADEINSFSTNLKKLKESPEVLSDTQINELGKKIQGVCNAVWGKFPSKQKETKYSFERLPDFAIRTIMEPLKSKDKGSLTEVSKTMKKHTEDLLFSSYEKEMNRACKDKDEMNMPAKEKEIYLKALYKAGITPREVDRNGGSWKNTIAFELLILKQFLFQTSEKKEAKKILDSFSLNVKHKKIKDNLQDLEILVQIKEVLKKRESIKLNFEIGSKDVELIDKPEYIIKWMLNMPNLVSLHLTLSDHYSRGDYIFNNFSKFKNLKHLSIEAAELSNYNLVLLGNLTNLTSISLTDLDHSKFQLPKSTYFIDKYITLNYNNLSFLSNLKNLKEIYLNIPLKIFPSELSSLDNLKKAVITVKNLDLIRIIDLPTSLKFLTIKGIYKAFSLSDNVVLKLFSMHTEIEAFTDYINVIAGKWKIANELKEKLDNKLKNISLIFSEPEKTYIINEIEKYYNPEVAVFQEDIKEFNWEMEHRWNKKMLMHIANEISVDKNSISPKLPLFETSVKSLKMAEKVLLETLKKGIPKRMETTILNASTALKDLSKKMKILEQKTLQVKKENEEQIKLYPEFLKQIELASFFQKEASEAIEDINKRQKDFMKEILSKEEMTPERIANAIKLKTQNEIRLKLIDSLLEKITNHYNEADSLSKRYALSSQKK